MNDLDDMRHNLLTIVVPFCTVLIVVVAAIAIAIRYILGAVCCG